MIWLFTKPNVNSSVTSNKIAFWLSELLKLPLHHDKAALRVADLDFLIVINSGFAFCAHLPVFAKLVLRAKRIIWLVNDYTIQTPKPTSNGKSPMRAAFRIRHKRGLPDTDYWSTVAALANSTGLSAWLNFNALNFEPISQFRNEFQKTLFYYGTWRHFSGAATRVPYFDRYFTSPEIDTVVSSTSDKFDRYPVRRVPAIPPHNLLHALRSHGLGLYIEDTKSHGGGHMPATRFYEMLAAGLPMVFQPEAAPGLVREGFNVDEYVIGDKFSFKVALKNRSALAHYQWSAWGVVNHRAKLESDVLAAWRRARRNI